MNINSYNPIRSVNVEGPVLNVKSGSGTYANLINKVLDGTIGALVNNNGDIVGMDYNTGLIGAEDGIAQMIFAKQYAGKSVMSAVLVGFEIKAKNLKVLNIEEDEYGAIIHLENGETRSIGSFGGHNTENLDEDGEYLPEEVEIDVDELDSVCLAEVRNWLKRNYEHCLARGVQPTIEEEDGVVYVSDIEWGRPLSRAELDHLA